MLPRKLLKSLKSSRHRVAAKVWAERACHRDVVARLDGIERGLSDLARSQAADMTRLADAIAAQGKLALSERLPEVSDVEELGTIKHKFLSLKADRDRLRRELGLVLRQLELIKVSPPSFSERLSKTLRLSAFSPVRLLSGGDRSLKRARKRRELSIIVGSDLFDPDWYLQSNPDVAAAGLDPGMHYLESGWLETRDPGPEFSTSRYLKANPDVAGCGANPLVHYLEHGMGEGRSIGGSVRPQIQRSAEMFDPPAPVVLFSRPVDKRPRWKRSHVLAHRKGGLVKIGGLPIGTRLGFQGALEPALERLQAATGAAFVLDGGRGQVKDLEMELRTPSLCDGWMASESTLRLHWSCRSSDPIVVRALQWCGDKGLSLVGEGMVAGSTDFLDLQLVTPLHPLLLVFASTDGEIVGSDFIAFPSLFRGGLHYAEIGSPSLNDTGGPIVGLAERFRKIEDAWARLAKGVSRPFLRDIRIDLTFSDGTGPLLQEDVQTWLSDVLKINLSEAIVDGGTDPKLFRLLADNVKSANQSIKLKLRSGAPASLVLSADCLPTLQILVAGAENLEFLDAQQPGSLIFAPVDPAHEVVAAVLPASGNLPEPRSLPCLRGFWPQIEGARAPKGVLTAIRLEPRDLFGAQLLEPTTQATPICWPTEGGGAITVLLGPGQWSDDAMAATLLGLRNQVEAKLCEVYCVGSHGREALQNIERALGIPARAVSDWFSVTQGMSTELLLHLRPGVVLHDRRTLRHLAFLALHDGVCGASCPLLAHSRQGREWSVEVEAAGLVASPKGLIEFAGDVQRFWNAELPVARLPDDLWLARRSTLVDQHRVVRSLLLSTRVTASYYAPRNPQAVVSPLTLDPAENSLQVVRWF
jgi:hypothetical protein